MSHLLHFPVRLRFLLRVFLLAAWTVGAPLWSASLLQEPANARSELVVGLVNEPRTLNPVAARDRASLTVLNALHNSLVRVDQVTQGTERMLAERITVSDGGRRFRIELRQGVRFSDGEPFDAADVVFSFAVYLDPEVAAPQRDLLLLGGSGPTVRAVDAATVEVEFALAPAVGERFLDSLPMLPAHSLESAYREGRLPQLWGLDAAPESVVGLGPFRLMEIDAGRQIVLERNPLFWRRAGGRKLPLLSRLVFRMVGSSDGALAALLRGEIDLLESVDADQFDLIERTRSRELRAEDSGPGLVYDLLLFNRNDPPATADEARRRKSSWFQELQFRQALSWAIDREAIVRLVYRGRGEALGTHVSAGDRVWFRERFRPLPRSIEKAVELLAEAGFRKTPQGTLEDRDGAPVVLSLMVSSGNTKRARIAELIAADLEPLGIEVRVATLELRSLVERLTQQQDYDLALLSFARGDVDPNPDRNIFASTGASHLWRVQRSSPEPEWQQEIDALFESQASTADQKQRQRDFERIQDLLFENLPVLFLTGRNVLTARAQGLRGAQPGVLLHPLLWNVEELYWAP